MRGYSVEQEQLRSCAAALALAAQHARAEVASVRAEAEELFAIGWRGAAAGAFHTGWDEWMHGAAAMLDALERMSAAITESASAYSETDSNVRTSLTRLVS